ncbi:acyltransferase [Actinoplanes italicus]|uniref:Peptidoglycan/LPS O-acetylase OafA/YrhL n=1 Tax=Actinoplanes italicus TaxID=113567 RepID=A0A2T0KDK6_9ACTN|nr:acyltransferase [Actinoplanes italicus]PRX21006.1 peptidoglycan/LPS O-acetylase OafA/YrhL [Actinoplanes italicus]GIE31481.1 acyltransferase [Actinoplanes italicus]
MPTPDSGVPAARLNSLTSLRFFAAAVVVLVHLSAELDLPHLIDEAVGLGYAGVAFFFTLSGFVLAWTARPGDTARRFYGRRFARIWPAHAVVTVLTIPVIYLAGAEPVWGALTFVLTCTHVWIPSPAWHYAFNGPSWSLAAEAFFYAVFPVLIRVARRWQERLRVLAAFTVTLMVVAALAVVAVAPDTTWGFLLYLNPLYRLGEFGLGILLACAIRRGWRAPWPTWIPAAGGVGAYLALVLFAPHDSEGEIPRILTDSVLLPFFLAVIAAAASADLRGDRTPLRAPSLVALGDRSFALYLIHVPLIKAVDAGVAGRDLGDAARSALAVGLLAGSVCAAHLLFVAVERPAERYLRPRLAS